MRIGESHARRTQNYEKVATILRQIAIWLIPAHLRAEQPLTYAYKPKVGGNNHSKTVRSRILAYCTTSSPNGNILHVLRSKYVSDEAQKGIQTTPKLGGHASTL